MRLNLREIIEIPGGSVPFSQELDTALLDFPSVRAYTAPITAEGKVVNTAGILTLQGRLHAQMLCVCDRCGAEFSRTVDLDLHADITADAQDDDPEVFTLDGDWLDVDEVLSTCFILSMDTKCLCKPDCAGLCDRCGANLNLGPCRCQKPRDPRMAVLEQLLDNKTDEEEEAAHNSD